MRSALLVLSIAALLSGCARRTAYQPPAQPVPNAWPESGPAGEASAPTASLNWRDFFTEERLKSVIELALANNRDLRMSALNVEKMQAMYRIQRAQQFPQVNASVSGNVYRLPENMIISGITVPEAITIQTYTMNLGTAAWEWDLFGRIRGLKEAALERFLATQQTRSATQIALVAGLAQSYLALAADRENLRLAEETLSAQLATLELIRQTKEAGLASSLEVKQAQSQVEAARTDIARYSGLLQLDTNLLTLLVGAPVPADLLPQRLPEEPVMQQIRAGLPSEVLLIRPDILAAEHQLKAAYANIGSARAAYFPRISLTAGAGFMSTDLRDLFRAGAATWSFAPQVALPIFDSGARKAAVRVAEVDRDLAIAAYEKAIQTSFREVSDSLSQRANLMQLQNAQQALVDTLTETYRLAEARYKAGIDSYLAVLIAQRAMYGGQQGLVAIRFADQANRVTLYKVLGGGA